MLKKHQLKIPTYLSFGINIILIGIVLIIKPLIPPVVPLFYGLPYGQQQLVSYIGLTIIPLSGIVITIINLLFSFYTKDPFYKKTLVVASLVITILGAISVLKIIFLVGFF